MAISMLRALSLVLLGSGAFAAIVGDQPELEAIVAAYDGDKRPSRFSAAGHVGEFLELTPEDLPTDSSDELVPGAFMSPEEQQIAIGEEDTMGATASMRAEQELADEWRGGRGNGFGGGGRGGRGNGFGGGGRGGRGNGFGGGGPVGPAGAVGSVGPVGSVGGVGHVGPVGGHVGPVGPVAEVGSVGPVGAVGGVGAVGPRARRGRHGHRFGNMGHSYAASFNHAAGNGANYVNDDNE